MHCQLWVQWNRTQHCERAEHALSNSHGSTVASRCSGTYYWYCDSGILFGPARNFGGTAIIPNSVQRILNVVACQVERLSSLPSFFKPRKRTTRSLERYRRPLPVMNHSCPKQELSKKQGFL
jgi:hypothetical protein